MKQILQNKPIYIFLTKAIGFFILWYLIYELWLLPDGQLDEWLSLNIVQVSGGILDTLGFSSYRLNRVVGLEGNAGIEIVNGCNGIAAMGLFIGFIIAYPGRRIYKLSFLLFGLCVIYLTNVTRIVVLALTQEYWPEFFDITHNYSTSTIFYLVIFMLWVIWMNNENTTSSGKKVLVQNV
jgi:exosortase family protein XrtF